MPGGRVFSILKGAFVAQEAGGFLRALESQEELSGQDTHFVGLSDLTFALYVHVGKPGLLEGSPTHAHRRGTTEPQSTCPTQAVMTLIELKQTLQ